MRKIKRSLIIFLIIAVFMAAIPIEGYASTNDLIMITEDNKTEEDELFYPKVDYEGEEEFVEEIVGEQTENATEEKKNELSEDTFEEESNDSGDNLADMVEESCQEYIDEATTIENKVAITENECNKDTASEDNYIEIQDNTQQIVEIDSGEAVEQPVTFEMSKEKEVVVVLDPGYDNIHVGAQVNDIREEEINLKIANYCKAELEKYFATTVYLTRELDGECPYPETTAEECIEKRVSFAQGIGTDIYVSIHNNLSSDESVHSAIVFYPNLSYNPSVSTTGEGVAEKIMKELAALGLHEKGILTKDSTDIEYPDGSKADYYAEIRNGKLQDIPAVLVENTFATNVDDLLNSEERLKAIGTSTATAIAEYFMLIKREAITLDSMSVDVTNNDAGVAVINAFNVTPLEQIEKVSFEVWSKDDKSDLYRYDVSNEGTGNYSAILDINNHSNEYGKYFVVAYAYDIYGGSYCIGEKACTFVKPSVKINVVEDSTQTNYKLVVKNLLQKNVKNVDIAVWSKKSGQDDLIWYSATENSTGDYEVNIPIKKHKTSGIYYADVYVKNIEGKKNYVTETTFYVTAPSVEKIEIVDENIIKGTFNVLIGGIQSKSDISKVQVPVWSKSNQSDIYWYTAEKQSDGSYRASVSLANHNYYYGKYYIDTYVTTENGIRTYTGGKTVVPSEKKAKIVATANETQTTYDVAASNVEVLGGVKSIRFAVWSNQNGQDDLKWYNTESEINGKWSASVLISNHKSAGKYYVDAYATNCYGKNVYIGGTTFYVTAPSVSAVKLVDYNEAFGIFGVEIVDVQSVSGVQNIRVAVWSSNDQKDLVWYNASLTSAGTYKVNVDIKNHNNNKGKYYADVYITAKNGIKVYAGGINCSILNVSNRIGTITSCEIVSGSREGITIRLKANLDNNIQYFNKYYLVETDSYSMDIEKSWMSKEDASGTIFMDITISGVDEVNAALMDKFALAIRNVNGNLILASEPMGITNPEAVAENTTPILKPTSKKGLQGIGHTGALDTNSKNTLFNLDLASVVGNGPAAGYVAYEYKGRTYYFSNCSDLVAEFKELDEGIIQYAQGITGKKNKVCVTLNLLLSYKASNAYLIDPAARKPGHNYYTLNMREERARETLEAVFLYLGELFGQHDCYVTHWVLGNEVNSSKAWNYQGSLSFAAYMQSYATAFRLLYNGVKAAKTGNNVYISLDNGWTAAPDTYAGKTTLDTFASYAQKENPHMRWSIAYHGYSYPLTRVDFWNDSSNTVFSTSTKYISMKNISVLTDYAAALERTYNKPSGSIRVIFSEQGYTAGGRYDVEAKSQAQALARGYYMAEFNNRVDAFIIRALNDDSEEMKGNLYFGLKTNGSLDKYADTKRITFYTYEYMDSNIDKFANVAPSTIALSSENQKKVREAQRILSNTNWSSIIPGFSKSKLAGMY